MRLLFWRGPRVPVLVLHGMLAARMGTLNLAGYGDLIDRALHSARRLGHLILDINSPGGSAVQSDQIASRIRARAEEHKVRVHAVIGEVGASGGYWLACAGDEILANAMSVVGSIGVVGGGFGFEDAIGRLGVRRRLYTAGENKARFEPFTPERLQDVEFVHGLLSDIHERFKQWVRVRRGERLKADEAVLFDGSFMLGAGALEAGLIDRFGDADLLVREIGGGRAKAQTFRPRRRGLLARLPRLTAEALLDAIEERSFPRV